MRVHWRKEWTTPAVVGVSSFAVGAAVGALGYKIKIDREVEAGLQAMTELAKASKTVGVVDDITMTDEGLSITGRVYDEGTLEMMTERAQSAFEQGKPVIEDPAVSASIRVPDSDELDYVLPPGMGPDGPAGAEAQETEVCEIESEEDPSSPVDETRNVFSIPWDESDEEDRTEDAPYVLHQDEYFQNEKDYRQTQLTWYEGDKILTDPDNVPIYDTSIVGRLEFGRGTNDPDTVYIRNDKYKAEYEVVRNHSHYQTVVMGLHAEELAEEDELKHSQRVLRFRED